MKCLLLLATLLLATSLVDGALHPENLRGGSPKVKEVNTTGWTKTCFLSSGELTNSTRNTDCQSDSPPFGSVLASAVYNASRLSLGWDFLEVDGQPGWHTGFLEGYLSAQVMMDSVALRGIEDLATYETMKLLLPKVATFLESQWNYMQQKATKDAPFSSYWQMVGELLKQVEGLADGFNTAVLEGRVQGYTRSGNVTAMDMFAVNLGPELSDIITATNLQSGVLDAKKTPLLPAKRQTGMHCSALVKPTEDDLFVAHDTWSGYQPMNYRIYKVYRNTLPRTGSSFPLGVQIAFSSYPGTISSGDDWYQVKTPNSLDGFHYFTVQETTNEVFNTSLYHAVVPQTVSEFLRVMTANFLCKSGESWTENFALENSGTYNNQYMVVDFGRYAPGSSIPDGTLWIAEQIPGYVARLDVSHVLREQGYWASYNIPYDDYVYRVSGFQQQKEQVGSYFSYTKYARPEIFRRNNTDVTDIYSMMKMMRYNNYKKDPLSVMPNCTGAAGGVCSPQHSAMLTVASRGDLMPSYNNSVTEQVAHFGDNYWMGLQGCFGAIDTKIATFKNRFSSLGYIIAGPTSDQHPPFAWGSVATNGNCPDAKAGWIPKFDFDWISFVTKPFGTQQ